jgi:hypothetical protein
MRPRNGQAAMEALILVATLGGPTMLARIGNHEGFESARGARSTPTGKSIIGDGGSSRGTVERPYITVFGIR